MAKFKQIKGDFWEIAFSSIKFNSFDALVCTTNTTLKKDGSLVMGAGLAKDFRDKFKGLDREWGINLSENNDKDGFMVTHRYSPIYDGCLVAFPTKYSWTQPSSLSLIEKSTRTLIDVANIFAWDKILMTRPGCKNGKLNWGDVSPILEKYLDERFTICEKA